MLRSVLDVAVLSLTLTTPSYKGSTMEGAFWSALDHARRLISPLPALGVLL